MTRTGWYALEEGHSASWEGEDNFGVFGGCSEKFVRYPRLICSSAVSSVALLYGLKFNLTLWNATKFI